MPTFYHASSAWMEQPDMSYVKSGDGNSSHGLGVYVTESPRDATEFLSTRGGHGAVYSFQAEKPAGWIRVTDPMEKGIEAHVLQAIGAVATPKIAQEASEYVTATRSPRPPRAYELLHVLEQAFPDQRRQNEILLGAGVRALQMADQTCIIDPTVLPTSMHVHAFVGQGPAGKPAHIEVGSPTRDPNTTSAKELFEKGTFKSEELSRGAHAIQGTNNTVLAESFERAAKALLTPDMTGDGQPPGSSLSQTGYAARNGLGLGIQRLMDERRSGKEPDPYWGGMATLRRNREELQSWVGADHPAVTAWSKMERDLSGHVRSQASFQAKVDTQPLGAVEAGRVFVGADSAKGTVLHAAIGLVATSRDPDAMVNASWMLQHMRPHNAESNVPQQQVNTTVGRALLDAIQDPRQTGAVLAKKLDALRLPNAVEMRTRIEQIARQVVRAVPEVARTAQHHLDQLRVLGASKTSQAQESRVR